VYRDDFLVHQETDGSYLQFNRSKVFAVVSTSCEAIWLCKLVAELTGEMLEPTIIHCDNQSCIKLIENPVFHDRSKRVEIL